MKILDKAVEVARAMFPDELDQRTFHVTCIFERSTLLCVGQNKPKTHRRNMLNNTANFDVGIKGTCSELATILKAKSKYSNIDWRRVTLVNIRIGRDGGLKLSKPCVSCESLLAYFEPGAVYYSTNEGEFNKY